MFKRQVNQRMMPLLLKKLVQRYAVADATGGRLQLARPVWGSSEGGGGTVGAVDGRGGQGHGMVRKVTVFRVRDTHLGKSAIMSG